MPATTNFGKIVVASDFHYGLGRNSRRKLQILKEYVEPALLDEMGDGSVQATLVVCGDLFHEMVSVRTDIYKEARSFVARCAENARVILLAGNHDCFDDTTDVTSIELFEQMDNVDVFRFPVEEDIYGLKCLFLPWSDSNQYTLRYGESCCDCVFCHPDVPREFFSGIYEMDAKGHRPASAANRKAIEEDPLVTAGLSAESQDGEEKVSKLESVSRLISLVKAGGDIFAGHIHTHGESRIRSRMFRFVGSPYQTTAEEIGTRSGYYVIDDRGTRFSEIHAPEFVRIRFSDVKRVGVENYDFSVARNNIVQFDGDEVISVETEARIKRKVSEESPFEVSETDYSNLVEAPKCTDQKADEYQRAFAASPRQCVEMYVGNMPDKAFEDEGVSRKKVLSTFGALYDFIDRKVGAVVSDGGADVRYETLSARNFLSYDRLDFDFQRYGGLTLVYGRNLDNVGATNACGKSNLIKALVYGLFGRFPKKVKKENMVPWSDPTGDMEVSVVLSSNGTRYRIDSGMKGGKTSFHRVYNLTTGEEMTRKQLAETRKFIETEILHCGFDMFMKTTVLTSSEIFNFYGMKKEDKDDYLNTIFGTKTLNEVREAVKAHLKESRGAYMEKARLLESKERDIELNRGAMERFEENRKAEVERLESEARQLEVQAEESLSSMSVPDSGEAARLSDEACSLQEKVRATNSEIRAMRERISTLSRTVESSKATVAVMRKELAKHTDVVPKLCDRCKKIAADGYGISGYAKTIRESKAKCEAAEREMEGLVEKAAKAESERDVIARSAMEAEAKARAIRSSSGEPARLRSAAESKRSTIEYVRSQVNPNVRIVETLESDRKRLESEVEESLSKLRHLDFIQSKVVSQEVITNLLTSRFIRQLNERIRYYLQRLGLSLGVEFCDDFGYEFRRGDGATPEFNSLSGGESLRIVIATSFAFKDFLESRRNISSNVRLLDEFFEKDADNLGMNSTVAILKDFSRVTGQNVFLVSNKLNEIDDGAFDNVLVVTIENSVSRIEEERVGGQAA